MQEEIKKINKSLIKIENKNRSESYIRKKGQDFKKGSVLKKGHKISARDIGLLIS